MGKGVALLAGASAYNEQSRFERFAVLDFRLSLPNARLQSRGTDIGLMAWQYSATYATYFGS